MEEKIKDLEYFNEINEYYQFTNYPTDDFIKLFNNCLLWVELGGDASKNDFQNSIWDTVNNHLKFYGDSKNHKWEILRQYCDPDEPNLKDATQMFEDDLYAVAEKIRNRNIQLEKDEMECD